MIAVDLLLVGVAAVALALTPSGTAAAAGLALGALAAARWRAAVGFVGWGAVALLLVGLCGVAAGLGAPSAVAGAVAVLGVHAVLAGTAPLGPAALAVAYAGVAVEGTAPVALAAALVAVAPARALGPAGLRRAWRWGLGGGVILAIVAVAAAMATPGPSTPAVGLGATFSIGDFDRLVDDDRVVATVRVPGGADDVYLRGPAFDAYADGQWTATGPARRLRAGDGPGVRARVAREPLDPPVLFDLGVGARLAPLSGEFVWSADRTALSAVWAPGAVAYDVVAAPPFAPDGVAVVDATPATATEAAAPTSPALAAWAASTRGPDPVAARLAALRAFAWTLSPEDAGAADPIAAFLDRGTGTCGHFATTLALALRLDGLPTRVVTGYAHGERVDAETFVFRRRDAHAWVAVRTAAGWVELDPTPGGAAPLGPGAAATASAPVAAGRALGGVAALGIGAAAIAAWLRRRAPATRLDRAWDRAVAALARQGVIVPEGPVLAAARRVAPRLGVDAVDLIALAAHRQAVVWGGEPDGEHVVEAERLAARIAAMTLDDEGSPS